MDPEEGAVRSRERHIQDSPPAMTKQVGAQLGESEEDLLPLRGREGARAEGLPDVPPEGKDLAQVLDVSLHMLTYPFTTSTVASS